MKSSRREFVRSGLASASVLAFKAMISRDSATQLKKNPALGGGGFRLGLVTYNIAKDWDIATIIKNCEATGYEAVELRTTHKHGVEPTLNKAQRAEVKQREAVMATLPEDARRAVRYMALLDKMKSGESMLLMPFDLRIK